MKPEDFDGEEVVDSMKAAASRLGVLLELVKQCKQQGSRAFRGSRVYLRPLAEMIANRESETDTVLFPVPIGPEASPERISEFRELLRVSIRCGFLRASEIFEILLQQVIDHLCITSSAATSGRPKRELVDTFDKVTRAIHQGFGIATWLLDDSATDKYLKRSAATLERARKKLFQSHSLRRNCK
jgi:hypothetical protein